ncbi:DNA-binding domain-containing protein [Vibrio rhizosphaerae]|uniref:DNA-binding domain-containing protein n=1 Tax=Vibrio rhizosphaerae TaxID=398736 RepID=A0ABU4IR36_9VIBR|nr:DNA-binding domain-containing protein [Vibrio rhizosphaerae]MDW6091869.1 DNA-binding domain-containing protein [Vibrio rhizosphaerae]
MQQQFSQSILMQNDDALPQIDAASVAERQARFAVYRNNVYHSLTEALEEIYPVCKQVVGEDFFRMLAGHFIQRYPPTSPILSEYGAQFAEFSRSIPQLSSLPYFSELAQLEYQLLQLTHAADIPVLSISDIQQHLAACADPTQSVWQLTDPCWLWQTSYAVGLIYQAHQPDSAVMIQDIQWNKSEYLLLTKSSYYGVFYPLSADEYHLIQQLKHGVTLAQASQNIVPDHFPALFATLLQKPIIRAIWPQ